MNYRHAHRWLTGSPFTGIDPFGLCTTADQLPVLNLSASADHYHLFELGRLLANDGFEEPLKALLYRGMTN